MSHIERDCDACGKTYWTFVIKGIPQRRTCSDECRSAILSQTSSAFNAVRRMQRWVAQ